jgi:hypothetical protein
MHNIQMLLSYVTMFHFSSLYSQVLAPGKYASIEYIYYIIHHNGIQNLYIYMRLE